MMMLSSKASGLIEIVFLVDPLVQASGVIVAVKFTISPTCMLVQPFALGCGQVDEIFTSTSLEEFAEIVTESTIFYNRTRFNNFG
jgi:hypothetical protein